MSNYRVKHFVDTLANKIEDDVNKFIKENDIEVLRYRLILDSTPQDVYSGYVGILEYEELDHEN